MTSIANLAVAQTNTSPANAGSVGDRVPPNSPGAAVTSFANAVATQLGQASTAVSAKAPATTTDTHDARSKAPPEPDSDAIDPSTVAMVPVAALHAMTPQADTDAATTANAAAAIAPATTTIVPAQTQIAPSPAQSALRANAIRQTTPQAGAQVTAQLIGGLAAPQIAATARTVDAPVATGDGAVARDANPQTAPSSKDGALASLAQFSLPAAQKPLDAAGQQTQAISSRTNPDDTKIVDGTANNAHSQNDATGGGRDPDGSPDGAQPPTQSSTQASAPSPTQPAAPAAAAASSPAVAAATPVANAPAAVATTLQVVPQSQTIRTGAPDIAALAIKIATKSQAGLRQFDIRLDPPELGRVDVRLSFDNAGKAQATLTAERPETLHLLRTDSPHLERALKDAGLDLSNNGLNFSLKGEQRQADNGAGQTRGRALGVKVASSIDAIDAIEATSQAASLSSGLTPDGVGVDISV